MDPTSPGRDENGEANDGRAVEMVMEREGREGGGREKGLTVVTLLQ